MKRILFFYALFFIFLNSFAQAPEKMTYQAIIRDAGNNVIASTSIGMKISILKGSTSGTVVYTETQTPTTNINGLVTIIIGGTGFPINWSNDTYFIKTETDPAGGTNYTITGTMQLLSVPYALHANTADAVTAITINNLSDAKSNDALSSYYIGHNSGVNADDAAISNTAVGSYAGNLITTGTKNTAIGTEAGVTDGALTHTTALGYNAKASANHQVVLGTISETVIIPNVIHIIPQDWGTTNGPAGGVAGDLYVESSETGSHTKGLYYYNGTNWEQINKPKYAIGDLAFGGLICYLDETGEHGLICSEADFSVNAWTPDATYPTTVAEGDGLWAGEMNTNIIIAQFETLTGHAAYDCSRYTASTSGGPLYGDWYLPSLWELQQIYDNRAALSIGSTYTYWSSTDAGSSNTGNAYKIDFSTGITADQIKTTSNHIRAVRKF